MMGFFLNKLWWCRHCDDNNSDHCCLFLMPLSVLVSLCWLPVKSRIEFKVLLRYKALNGQAPSYLTELVVPYHLNRTLRPQNTGLLAIPGVAKCSLQDSAVSSQAPPLFPVQISRPDTILVFKRIWFPPLVANRHWLSMTLHLDSSLPFFWTDRLTHGLLDYRSITDIPNSMHCWWLSRCCDLYTHCMFMHRREKDPSLLQWLGFCWGFLTQFEGVATVDNAWVQQIKLEWVIDWIITNMVHLVERWTSAVAETDDDLMIIMAQIKILVFRIYK